MVRANRDRGGRIVDCRDDYGNTVPDSVALDKYLVKVNPVEAWFTSLGNLFKQPDPGFL